MGAIEDMSPGTYFRRVILDYNPLVLPSSRTWQAGLGDNARHLAVTKSGAPLSVPLESFRRMIICSGQIYYSLAHARRVRKIKDIVILRLEQISPFPHDRVTDAISFYPNAELVWCQEEPKNMGAWFYVQPRLATALQHSRIPLHREPVRYIGRCTSAATATGSPSIHTEEMRHILDLALAP